MREQLIEPGFFPGKTTHSENLGRFCLGHGAIERLDLSSEFRQALLTFFTEVIGDPLRKKPATNK
jgi:hypothetical protein